MATREDVASFLDTYTRSWKEKTGDRPDLFHPGGGVLYPGSDEPVSPDTGPSITDQLRQVAPDVQVALLHWAEREDVLFAEWELTCTLGGRPLRVVGVNRFALRGNRALEATAFLDRMALLEYAEPEREHASLASLLASALRGAQ